MGNLSDVLRKCFWPGIALLVVLAIVLLVVGFFIPYSWSETQFDITAGRQRSVRYNLFQGTTYAVKETAVSQLYRQVVGEPPPPKWHMVYGDKSWVLRGRLIDGTYSGPWMQSEALIEILRMDRASNETKKIVLTRFFDLLQEDESTDNPIARATMYADGVRSYGGDKASVPVSPRVGHATGP